MSSSRLVVLCAVLAACGNEVQSPDLGRTNNLGLPPYSAVASDPVTSWAAEYYATTNLAGPPLKRTETILDFDWGRGSPDPSIPEDGFSARWTGTLEAATAATYDFTTTSDDGFRVAVDGQTLIDFWTDHAATDFDASLNLGAGTHRVSVEFYENWGDAVARVAITKHSACDPNLPPAAPPIDPPTPTDPPVEAPGTGTATAYNILVRGQSNALLFVDRGGVWTMRRDVAASLGVSEDKIKIIADWAHQAGHNTINSGTGFIADWMDGARPRDLENGLLAAIADMSDADKRNPTLVLWMHNEYDQQHEGLDTATWLTSARGNSRFLALSGSMDG